MQRQWHTPVSILVAGGFIAVAIYLGLRSSGERAAPDDATAPSARSVAGARGVSSPSLQRDRHTYDESAPSDRPDARGPSPASASTPPLDRRRVSEADQATAVAPPLGGMPPVAPALVKQVQQDAHDAFDGIRNRVRSECWDTLPDEPEAPETVGLTLSLSFDPHGTVLASGITEDREQNRPGLAACLGPLIHDLAVRPPGSHLAVEIDVDVP